MSKRKRAGIQVAALSIICGLIIWHVIHWQASGMYLEMFWWVGTDKGCITVLYNLGLMVLLGAVLGFLMEKMTVLLGYHVGAARQSDEGGGAR